MRYIVPFAITATAIFAGCAGGPSYQYPVTAGTAQAVGMQQAGMGMPQAPAMPQAGTIAQSMGLPQVDMAAAQRILTPDETLQTIDFPESGTKTVSGRIEGYKSVAYAMPIRKGQRLEVTMDTKSTSAYFNIIDTKDTSGAALFAGEMNNTRTALIRATEDATYVLRPYLNRAVARRGSSADYTFKIERQ